MKIVLVSTLLSTANCASILHDGKQSVRIDTIPSGAEVSIGNQIITTPGSVSLKGKSEYVAVASKKGYKDTTGVVNGDARIGSGIVGNIFNLTGIVGMALDFFGTGAGWRMDDQVTIKMRDKDV